MWKTAREEFKEVVWLVCIIGGLSVLAVASAAALAAVWRTGVCASGI